MRLAIVCTEKMPLPAVRGGAIQMMIDGICPFLKEWYEVTAFCAEDPELPQEETLNEIRYIRVPDENFISNVAAKLRQEHYDIIHICNRPKFVPACREAAPNSILTLSLHNEMFDQKKITLREGQSIIRELSLITAVSSYIKETVIARFPEATKKLRVLYSGVELAAYPPVWTEEGLQIRSRYREMYGLQDKKVILFAGRLSKVKGPDLLIRAMEYIVPNHPDAVLVIAGGKWFSDDTVDQYVRRLYRLAEPYGDHVQFTKFIPADEIQNMFLMSDVFVCSSQWQEPLARVHYEAMAAGIPLVTSNRGGNREVILNEYNGLLVNYYDQPEAYANAIHHILSEPKVAAWMAQNARRFVESNFQFEHVARRLHLLYEHACTEEKSEVDPILKQDPVKQNKPMKQNKPVKRLTPMTQWEYYMQLRQGIIPKR